VRVLIHVSLGDAIHLANRAFRHESLERILSDGAALLAQLLATERVDVLQVPVDGSELCLWPGASSGPAPSQPGSAVPPGWEGDLVEATLAADGPLLRTHPGGGAASWTMVLRTDNGAAGLLGVFDVPPSNSDEQSFALAETIAGVMATAVAGSDSRETLQWHTRLDQLLTEVSTQFIDLGADQIDKGIIDASPSSLHPSAPPAPRCTG
jgi:hypothetical protein